MHFSASTRGFYGPDHPALPADAVPITPARHAALLEAEASGKLIEPDAGGRPVIRTRAVTVAQRRGALIVQARAETARRIDLACPLWRQLNLIREGRGDEVGQLVDPLRAIGNAIEARIARMASADLATFDPASADLWPD